MSGGVAGGDDSYDVIVIGAGMAGINAAATAHGAGRRVAVIERDRVGGTCPIRGCIPTKAIVRSAEVAHEVANAATFGVPVDAYHVDFPAVMARVRGIIDRGSKGAQGYLESLDDLDLIFGEGSLEGPGAVRVDGRVLRAPRILLTTGAQPVHIPVPGLDQVEYLTSDDVVLRLNHLPDRLLVIGAGPIGLELGQALHRFGAAVTIVEALPRMLPDAEPEIAEGLGALLREEGLELIEGGDIVRVSEVDGERRMLVRHGGIETELAGDAILLGAGRAPALDALNLEAAGIEHTAHGIAVDDHLATSAAGIYAAGDVVGKPYGMFTHVARQLGRDAIHNALGDDPRVADSDVGPRAIFTDPEVAMIGMSESQAREAGCDISVGTSGFSGGKARAWGVEHGSVKIVLESGTRRILGAQILAYHAADLLHPIVVAMHAPGGTADPIIAAPHIHPTLGEVVKSAVESAAG